MLTSACKSVPAQYKKCPLLTGTCVKSFKKHAVQRTKVMLCKPLFKPGACGRSAHAWFLQIVSSANVCMFAYVCVCPPPRPLITSHVKGMRNNRIMKFYGYSVSLYDTTVDKLYSPGLSNNAGRECLPKKSQLMRY